jgi:hypothetical protein
MFKKIIPLLFSLSFINAQIALPTFHAVHKPHTAEASSSGTFTFTNCSATGREGPTQSQVNSTYTSGNSLYNGVTINTQGLQEWTVPETGTYTIESYGAQGGGDYGGKGAKIIGTFDLSQGDVLKILIGQVGEHNASDGRCNSSGGGGGTYVTKSPYNNTSSILVIAGGGGGAGDAYTCSTEQLTGTGGSTGNDGLPGTVTTRLATIYGTGGNGGSKAGNTGASCGAGFIGNSTAYLNSSWADEAYSFINGGEGANMDHNSCGADGGFGGGGAGAYGAGGGGGYSGGGTGDYTSPCDASGGGGGGSYNSGSNPSNTAGTWEEHGQVIITY